LPRDAVRRAPHDDSHICPPSLLAQGTSRNGLSFGDHYLRAERAYAGARNYDNEGNLTKKSKGTGAETWFYGYDNLNHLTSAKQEATDGGTLLMQATYVYDH